MKQLSLRPPKKSYRTRRSCKFNATFLPRIRRSLCYRFDYRSGQFVCVQVCRRSRRVLFYMMSCLLRRHRQLVEEAEVGGKRLWRMSFCQGQDFSTALGPGRIRGGEPWHSAGPKLRHRHGSSGSGRPGRVDVRPQPPPTLPPASFRLRSGASPCPSPSPA